jgi:hypothetical protein
LCNEKRHRLALLIDHVFKSISHILIRPELSRASMPCPAPGAGRTAFETIQLPAGIGFELVHNSLGPNLGFHDGMNMVGMNMVGSDVRRP